MQKISKSKIISLVLATIFIISLFSGCGAQNASNVASQNESNGNKEVTSSNNTSSNEPADLKGKIVIWSYQDQALLPMIDEFKKIHPNAEIERVTVMANDSIQKVQTSLASGMELGDIVVLELTKRGKLMDFNCWEDLEAAPYNFDKNLLFDFAIPLITDANGKVVCLPWDQGTAALSYKRPLAKKYFGTDDPDELYKMLQDWDTFIEKCKEINVSSGGKVFAFASLVDVNCILTGQNNKPYVNKDGKANFDETIAVVIKNLVRFRDSGIIHGLQPWTPAWFSTFSKDEDIFYPCGVWFPGAAIIPNDKNNQGRWGLMNTPSGSFLWGGSAMAIYNKSKNKELAWEFAKFCTLDNEGAKLNKQFSGYFTNLKEPYKDPVFMSWKLPAFGEQDIGNLLFGGVAPSLKTRPVTKWDLLIDDSLNLVIQALENDRNLDAETAYQKFLSEMKNRAPELF